MNHRPFAFLLAITALVTVFLATSLFLPGLSAAQDRTALDAEAHNDAGKNLYKRKNYAGAAYEFQEAVNLKPDARYYFNLCATHEKLSQYEQALNACDAVYQHNPEDRLKGKTGKRAANIRRLMRDQGAGTDAGTGAETETETETGTGTGTGAGTNNVGVTPVGQLDPAMGEVEAAVAPGLDYKWSIGGGFGAAFGSSLSDIPDLGTGSAFQAHVDFFMARKALLGLRLYGGGFNFTADDFNMTPQLSGGELGAGVYYHQRLLNKFYVTPMAGIGMGILYPSTVSSPFFVAAFRAEVALQWVMTPKHAFSFSPLNLTVYTGSQKPDAAVFGLDTGGAIWSVTIGYTYRFQKSFQQLVTLE